MKLRKEYNKKSYALPLFNFIFVCFLVWFLISFFTMDTSLKLVTQYKFPEAVSLKNFWEANEGDWALAIDGKSVAGKNFENSEKEIRPTASTIKMILGLAIMREKPFSLGEVGEIITIDKEMYDKYIYYINNGGSYTAVRMGEEISEYDALVSVFLASSNNMADSLAIWAFGSLENYQEYATNMLAELGIKNTTIGVDASGFSETATSTAEDLAKIGAKVLEEPVLAEIVKTEYYEVPVAGLIYNTNGILGKSGVIGVKTGYIGEVSGYCLISGYKEGEHIMTIALLGMPTRDSSFNESLALIQKLQSELTISNLVEKGREVGYYNSWWTGPVEIRAEEDFSELLWAEAEKEVDLEMSDEEGTLSLKIAGNDYKIKVRADAYENKPSLMEKIMHVFGWEKGPEDEEIIEENIETEKVSEVIDEELIKEVALTPITAAESSNCTIDFGYLMLINPNFTVETNFINTRRGELVSLSQLYGIIEGNPYNGDNLLDAEAATHINEMIEAYKADYPGHTLETRSCFRAVGTNCGRLCAATGASDHHTGLTCDLLDPVYGTTLDTDYYSQHLDWQWLKENSYKYGFIDRFPEAWAGGLMSEPLNVDENGSTGLFETWHYRYVGVDVATEIATGKYNNGEYDSLEHYLKARGLIIDLKNGVCK